MLRALSTASGCLSNLLLLPVSDRYLLLVSDLLPESLLLEVFYFAATYWSRIALSSRTTLFLRLMIAFMFSWSGFAVVLWFFFTDLGDVSLLRRVEQRLVFVSSYILIEVWLTLLGDLRTGMALIFCCETDLFLDLLRLGTLASSMSNKFLNEGLVVIFCSIIPYFLIILIV